MNNKNYFLSFVINYNFKENEKKYTLKKIVIRGDKFREDIENEVKKIMDDIIFHRLDVVNGLYKEILDIELAENWRNLLLPVLKRHDIFHRNGKDKLGNNLIIESYDIKFLIEEIKKFINDMEIIISAKI